LQKTKPVLLAATGIWTQKQASSKADLLPSPDRVMGKRTVHLLIFDVMVD